MTRTLRTDAARLATTARPVVRALFWTVAVAGAVLYMGLDTPPSGAEPAPAPVPVCASEDAAGPCTWDATEQGNGTGESFAVDADGNVTVTSPATVPANPAIVATDGHVALTDDFTADDADDLAAALGATLDRSTP